MTLRKMGWTYPRVKKVVKADLGIEKKKALDREGRRPWPKDALVGFKEDIDSLRTTPKADSFSFFGTKFLLL
jgi:hypothetical protein